MFVAHRGSIIAVIAVGFKYEISREAKGNPGNFDANRKTNFLSMTRPLEGAGKTDQYDLYNHQRPEDIMMKTRSIV